MRTRFSVSRLKLISSLYSLVRTLRGASLSCRDAFPSPASLATPLIAAKGSQEAIARFSLSTPKNEGMRGFLANPSNGEESQVAVPFPCSCLRLAHSPTSCESCDRQMTCRREQDSKKRRTPRENLTPRRWVTCLEDSGRRITDRHVTGALRFLSSYSHFPPIHLYR